VQDAKAELPPDDKFDQEQLKELDKMYDAETIPPLPLKVIEDK